MPQHVYSLISLYTLENMYTLINLVALTEYRLSELKILTEPDEKNVYFVHKSNTDKYQSKLPKTLPPKGENRM